MKNVHKTAIIVLVFASVVVAATVSSEGEKPRVDAGSSEKGITSGCCPGGVRSLPKKPVVSDETGELKVQGAPTPKKKLPRIVDLGAGKCIPCKMMAPILDELKKTYAGQMDVVFIDVWKNPDAGKQYRIKLIPTQIFYDAKGKERFRHEGFFSKEDILAKCKELGFNFKAPKGKKGEADGGAQ